MATFLVNGDVLRITIACRMPSHAQAGLNVLHYKVTTAGSMTLEAVPLAMYNRVVTQYAAWLSGLAQFSGVSVTRVKTATRPAAGPFYQVFPQTGTGGSEIMPLQTSGIIRFTTPGDPDVDPQIKSSKGRAYIPFGSLTNYLTTGGTLSTVGFSRLEAIRAVLGPSLILTGGAVLQQVLRRTKTNPPPTPPTFLGYTSVSVLTSMRAIATQRRRGDFGKVNSAFGGVI